MRKAALIGMFVGLLSALITIALFAGLGGTSGFGLIEARTCGCCSPGMLGGTLAGAILGADSGQVGGSRSTE